MIITKKHKKIVDPGQIVVCASNKTPTSGVEFYGNDVDGLRQALVLPLVGESRRDVT